MHRRFPGSLSRPRMIFSFLSSSFTLLPIRPLPHEIHSSGSRIELQGPTRLGRKWPLGEFDKAQNKRLWRLEDLAALLFASCCSRERGRVLKSWSPRWRLTCPVQPPVWPCTGPARHGRADLCRGGHNSLLAFYVSKGQKFRREASEFGQCALLEEKQETKGCGDQLHIDIMFGT